MCRVNWIFRNLPNFRIKGRAQYSKHSSYFIAKGMAVSENKINYLLLVTWIITRLEFLMIHTLPLYIGTFFGQILKNISRRFYGCFFYGSRGRYLRHHTYWYPSNDIKVFPGGSINVGRWKNLSGQIKNLGQIMWLDKIIYVGE